MRSVGATKWGLRRGQAAVRGPAAVMVSTMACALGAHAGSARASVVFSDGTFTPANWGFEQVVVGGGSGSASQSVGTGNPGEARRVVLTTGSGLGNTIYGFSRYGTTTATRYEPSVSGAISGVSITVDARFVTGTVASDGQGVMLGIKQGSAVFGAPLGVTGSSGTWLTLSASGLTPSAFTQLSAGPALDFSSSAAPLRFGFIASNSNGGEAYSTTVDYDNFSVVVTPVPAPGAAGALAGAGAVCVAGGRRRKR